MRKKTNKTQTEDILPEYDFKGKKAVRGKYYRSLEKGYTVHVHQSDGTTVVNHYTLAEGTVLLAPDVREYFRDSESVNDALRSLIHLSEKGPARKYSRPGTSSRQVAEKGK